MQSWIDTWSNCLEPWHPPGLNPIPVKSRWNSFICPLSENAWVPLCCWNTKSLCIYARCRKIDSTPGWDSKVYDTTWTPDEPGKGTEFLQCVSTHLGWQHTTVVAAASARLIVQSHFHNKKTQSANSSTAFGRETSLWVLHTQETEKKVATVTTVKAPRRNRQAVDLRAKRAVAPEFQHWTN